MSAAFVVLRAVHIGAAIVLFGELAFAVFVASGSWRRAAGTTPMWRADLERHLQSTGIAMLLAGAISGAGWLAIEASSMSGTPVGQVLDRETLGVVLWQTEFGRVWLLRAVGLVATAVPLLSLRRARSDASRARRTNVALPFAAVYLATLAWTGHAAAATAGFVRVLHLGSDAFHLLAAGAWLGALPALARCLRRPPSDDALIRLTQRFSVLGMACVSVLLATGIVNALFLVGSFAALLGTPYGKLLIVKLAVFAAMLGLAAINRWRLTPRLARRGAATRSALRRNAIVELAAGVVIIAIVGALGTMVPGAHQSPVWPFGYTVDFSSVDIAGSAAGPLLASAAMALAGLALTASGVRRRAAGAWLPGCLALLLSAAMATRVLAVPAFPTTYATSPMPYTVDVVARGAARYARACSSCHGAQLRGDGPAGASLPTPPIDIAGHALRHRPGNLFWWIAHGIPRSPMPAFSPQLTDNEIWELVQFLVARASAEASRTLGSHVEPDSISRVPDFTYELPQQEQQALSAPRTPALIVLYSMPGSRQRLAELASDHRIAHGSLRVIAIPLAGSEGENDANALTQIVVDGDVAAVYAMFAGATRGRPAHAELLVDGAGVLRARWSGLPADGADRDAGIVEATRQLPDLSKATAPMHHGH